MRPSISAHAPFSFSPLSFILSSLPLCLSRRLSLSLFSFVVPCSLFLSVSFLHVGSGRRKYSPLHPKFVSTPCAWPYQSLPSFFPSLVLSFPFSLSLSLLHSIFVFYYCHPGPCSSITGRHHDLETKVQDVHSCAVHAMRLNQGESKRKCQNHTSTRK
jgi:hypothetical protein